jgi:hypothetical protein
MKMLLVPVLVKAMETIGPVTCDGKVKAE